MASIYVRGKTFWIRKKDSGGKWISKSTGYRTTNPGDVQQAKLMARKDSREEQIIAASLDTKNDEFTSWVYGWFKAEYASRGNTTFARYCSSWRTMEKFLSERGVIRPRQIDYTLLTTYLEWREARNGSRNTALSELKLLSMVWKEAKKRNFVEGDNPHSKLGLRKDAVAEKSPWSDEQIQTVGRDLEKNHFGSWMHCTFVLGLYQAARLMQAQLPIAGINFQKGTISYPGNCVKGGKPFTQPLALALIPTLKKIVEERTAKGEKMLCQIPSFGASLAWREYLDGFGFTGISHHCLRVTWATRACLANVPVSQAMEFCHHKSELVHRVYQKLNSSNIANVPSLVPLPSF